MAARSLAIGDVLTARFRLERSLGIGGMAQVFRAHDELLDKTCAIKAMHGSLAGDPQLVERFVREGRATARIQSPHVVTVMDALTSESGIPFIVMEYLEGLDLARLEAKRGRLPIADVLSYLGQACTGLEAAHRLGIVHRDVKLQNIFVEEREGEEVVRLVDFGLARIAPSGMASVDRAALTAVGAVVGTVSYLAPEQISSSHDVDGRTDVWAVGVCLYRLLTGVLPFRGDNDPHVMSCILREEPEPIAKHRASAQPTLQSIVAKCLAKSPAARFGSAAELGAALTQSGDIATKAAFAPTLHAAGIVRERARLVSAPATMIEPKPIHIVEEPPSIPSPHSIPSPDASTASAPATEPPPASPPPIAHGEPAAGLRADHKLLIVALAVVVVLAGLLALSRRTRRSGPDYFEPTTKAPDDPAASHAATPPEPPGRASAEPPRRALSSPQLR